ncbi:sensor domain-containing protein [Halorhabdus salina]|uniref:sensor domain-containing protein n=1 Tax=Halorhabdus salina TaxID=2750670 RepID=UPI0015EF6A84|nr:sensor domain-containing protein [Halorhabdus salina]
MSRSPTGTSSLRGVLTPVFRSPTDRQTYRNLLYLFLSFPLGLLYYILVVTGFALGLGLSVFGIGIVILLGTVIGLRYLGTFERRLANALLRTDIPEPDDVERDDGGAVDTVKAYLGAASTWRGLGFVLLKFWLGVLSFVLLVSFLATAIELVVLPVSPAGTLNVEVFGWEVASTFDTTTQRLLAVPIGVCLALVGFPILNAFADVNASIASSLLGASEPNEET